MAKYEITAPDGNRFEITAPDGATEQQVMAYAQSQYTPEKPVLGKNMANLVPGQATDAPVGPEKQPSQASFASKALNVFAPAEGALALGTGMLGGVAGMIAGAGRTIAAGPNATPEDVQRGKEVAGSVADALTYRPRTEAAQDQLLSLSNLVRESKLAGLAPTGGMTLGRMLPAAVSQASKGAANIRSPGFLMPTPEPQMVGMGAATTGIPAMRIERAAQLPVPVQLTKGQASRQFDQVQFEREAAKNPTIGEPLRQRFADQNQQILSNFDAWLEQTGAQSPTLRATGEIVTAAVAEKANKAKAAIDLAYQQARESGEMAQKVNVEPLFAYLDKNRPQSINAGVIGSTKGQLNQLIGAQKKDTFGQPVAREISINDLEEIRKQVTAASTKDGPNSHFGREIRGMIDSLTENVGGQEYKYARRLRTQYANEFENVGVIDRLMSTKPGSKDRMIAYEDVFDRSILRGSLDDVRAVRKTLQTTGPKGEAAWKELQGQTIQYMKDEITKNVATDVRGNRVVSAARLDKLVTELDKDGKLDFIFGKKGAQQIRDVNDIAKDVFTAPPGAINTSNTASILIGLLDTALSGTTGLPLPIGTAIHQGAKYYRNREMKGRVADALNP